MNFYIKSLWGTKGKLDAETLKRLPLDKTRLSYKQREAALKQAVSIVASTRKSAKALKVSPRLPVFSGSAILSKSLVLLQAGKKSFDFVARVTSLRNKHRIIIPTKKTAVLNKWLATPLAKLVQGCALSEDKLIMWVELPDLPSKEAGESLGIDQGMNTLIATSAGNLMGDFKPIREKISRKLPKSKAKRRALEHRRHFIGEQLNKLPWSSLSVLGVEDLKNIKHGKGNLGKRFRKARIPWTVRLVTDWIQHKCEENRVLFVTVDPRNTSRTCPTCGTVSKKNRVGEKFLCVSCSYEEHADVVGAKNVLAKTTRLVGSLASPTPKNVERQMAEVASCQTLEETSGQV